MKRVMCLSVLAVALGAAQTDASDFNPLGFYIGGAVGQGRDAVDLENLGGGPVQAEGTTTGWKAMVGMRPISFLGGEVEYVDFGSSSANAYLLSLSHLHADGAALYAVGYLPIPVPFLDIFGKAGLARTQATYSGLQSCAPPALCIAVVNADRTESDFAYGAGVQAKFQSLAFRAEYERTDTGVGRLSLLSFGITWTF